MLWYKIQNLVFISLIGVDNSMLTRSLEAIIWLEDQSNI
jgi:hypothetical protein